MRIRYGLLIVSLVLAAVLTRLPYVRGQSAPSVLPAGSSGDQQFDPHDLSGVWRGDESFGNDRWENKTPEPPLTDWAKQHLLYKSISHDALAGKPKSANEAPPDAANTGRRALFATDLYGVIANDPDGEFPGKDCEPLSTPAMFDYPILAIMEFVPTRQGDRLIQFFEYHREWRTFWLNREHPKDLDPSYEGDSTARWEGNTLVVDTVGYNGKTMISGTVGHSKSDAFHLVERYRRLDHDHMLIELTYYDPKAWGDKFWPGFQKHYKLISKDDFEEFICSPREYKEYEGRMRTQARP